MHSAEESSVACFARRVAPEQIIALGAFAVLIFALPAHASSSALVWGNDGGTPAQVKIQDGGTYTVPLNASAPAHIAYPTPAVGILYQVTNSGGTPVRGEPLATIYLSNPETDTRFAWPGAGKYELDISVMQFSESYNDTLKRWLARALLADVAHAQFSEVVETLHFTIQEAVPACATKCFSNVLFLPGIESSRLYRPDYNGGTDRLWEPNANDDVRDLFLDRNGNSVRSDVYAKEGDVLDELPVTGSNVYKSFMAKMNNLKSQSLITDWEPVAYDWRLSLDDVLNYGNDIDGRIYYSGDLRATSTPYVIQELRRLAATSKSGEVTIIAHSNGGLLAKRLTKKLGSDASKLIDKIIFVAVPQAGTPMAIPADMHGYKQDHGPWGIVTTEQTARTFASTSPMAYHLLPSADYFTQVDDPVVSFDSSLPEWRTRYGETIHSQERLHAFLIDTYGRVDAQAGDADQPIQFDDTLLKKAEALHSDVDNWTPPTGIELIQIAGWGVPSTVSGVTYSKKDGGVKPEMNFTIDGDGTVVVPSALWTSTTTGATNYWVDLQKYNERAENKISLGVLSIAHADVLEVPSLLNFISEQITNTAKPISNYTYLSAQSPSASNLRLRYALHSPLMLELYDDLGNHTGVSTTTGQIEVNIPGTYFVQFGDVKYIFSDSGTPQHIIMSGYDTGTFTFEVGEWQGDTGIASTTFRDVPVTPQTIVRFDVSSGFTSASNLSVDANGDGTVDSSYASSTGQLIVASAPPEVSTAPSGGGGGGNGPPVLASASSASTTPVLDIATSTATTTAAATSTIITTINSTTTAEVVSTTTITQRVTVRKPPPKPPAPSAPKASTVPQAQVAAAAQVTGGSLWPRVRQWIMNTIYSLLRI